MLSMETDVLVIGGGMAAAWSAIAAAREGEDYTIRRTGRREEGRIRKRSLF